MTYSPRWWETQPVSNQKWKIFSAGKDSFTTTQDDISISVWIIENKLLQNHGPICFPDLRSSFVVALGSLYDPPPCPNPTTLKMPTGVNSCTPLLWTTSDSVASHQLEQWAIDRMSRVSGTDLIPQKWATRDRWANERHTHQCEGWGMDLSGVGRAEHEHSTMET